ncbi:MAG: hypothetical protein H6Q26_1995 [Bacteroidetes bacterium]|nr:hypothetical protein [Bacteroidota bacterium]
MTLNFGTCTLVIFQNLATILFGGVNYTCKFVKMMRLMAISPIMVLVYQGRYSAQCLYYIGLLNHV